LKKCIIFAAIVPPTLPVLNSASGEDFEFIYEPVLQ